MRLLLILPLFFTQVLAEVRFWTDDRDRKVEATLVGIEGDTVTLRLQDGRQVPFPLAKLSQADRDYVESRRGQVDRLPEEEAGAHNFGDPWPERVTFSDDPEISTVEENPAEKRFIYESANYRYVCDVRLSKSVVKGFAVMFEATHLYCRTIPIGLSGGTKTDGKYLILLFEEFKDYVKAGGPPDSAGVYIGGRNVVMVPLESLGVRPVGSSYMLDRDKSSKTLPHELTHQLTPYPYYGLGSRGWFTEGIADYIAVTPYRAGSFNARNNFKDIVEYATGYGSKGMGGRALGTKIHLPALRTFMLQSYESFLSNSQLNYGSGLLLTTYFFHLDGDGDGARIKAYLKALHAGKKGEDALLALLDGRTYAELEKDIAKGWGRKGIDFSFDPEEKEETE